MIRKAIVLLLSVLALLAFGIPSLSQESVVTLPIATPQPNLSLMLSRYATYGTGTWWTNRSYPNSIPTLSWTAGNTYSEELAVRGAAMNAFALAVNDPTNVTSARLIAAIARQHASNGVAGLQTWGYGWEDPLWAAYTGLTAMIAWDSIPNSTERDNVRRMLIAEADNVVANRPPLFWRDQAGVELRPGDSAAEENSWCATVLWVAAALMPTATNAPTWIAQADDLAISAFAKPGEDSRGSNVTSDYLVINHSRVHPDYMTTITQNFIALIAPAVAGRKNEGSPLGLYQAQNIYQALQSSQLDSSGTLAYNKNTPTVSFPVGTPNDWGVRRPAAYLCLDGLVNLYYGDRTAGHYASIHAADLASMQARPAFVNTHPAGSFVLTSVSPAEGTYPEENAYSASQVALLQLAKRVL